MPSKAATPYAHRLTNVLLRLGLGLFLLLWGVDKLVATQGAQNIFDHFYLLSLGANAIRLFGVVEILLGAAVMAGLFRTVAYGAGLAVHTVSVAASWRETLDPWGLLFGNGGTHLFIAGIPVWVAFLVLFINRSDGYLTLDALRANRERPDALTAG